MNTVPRVNVLECDDELGQREERDGRRRVGQVCHRHQRQLFARHDEIVGQQEEQLRHCMVETTNPPPQRLENDNSTEVQRKRLFGVDEKGE